MKARYLYILTLILALSCAKETLPVGGEMVTVPVSVAFEGITKVSEGDAADLLYVAVFSSDGSKEILRTTSSKEEDSFPLSLTLIKDENYKLVLWAQSSDNAVYTVPEGDVTAITADYSQALCSDESLDAFRGIKDFKANGRPVNVTLTRAVAMINFLSSSAPGSEAAAMPDYASSITVSDGLSTSYNALTGTPSSPISAPAVFDFAPVPGDVVYLTGVEQSPTYYRAAYIYALTMGESVAQVSLEISDNGQTVNTAYAENVPLQTNYRSNITGDLF